MKALFQITPRGILKIAFCFIMLGLASCSSNSVDRNIAGEEVQKDHVYFKKTNATGRSINQF